jgi:regulator of protease activity HflC (stomatin/prohibitin superfamily)
MKSQRGSGVIGAIVGALVIALAVIWGIWALASWQKVPAGNVGIHVYLLGGDKGVDAKVEPVGRVFVGWQQELYLYPTYTQNVKWLEKDGNAFNFSDIDGTPISADVGISYHVDKAKAATLFQTYRKGIDEITDGVLHQRVADALNDEASQLKVDKIYGNGREQLLANVQLRVQKIVAPTGIIVEKISWIGPPKLPANVQTALNDKIGATQKAQQRENEVQQAIAEANKAREAARGEADATLLRAEAEAKAIKIRGDALRENPALVDLTIAEKWDGKLPEQYLGGDGDGKILQIMKK